MPNLHLSVINDGSHYQTRLNLALDMINGVISKDEFEAEIRNICDDQAYKEFIEMEMLSRKEAQMPPFTKMAVINIAGKYQEKTRVPWYGM